jgi:hypothetical protein
VPDADQPAIAEDHEQQVMDGDVSIFKIRSQSSAADQTSMLLLQKLVRTQYPGYTYLEVGSHIGGSLLPHLLDSACASVVSVDPRPTGQPDERGRRYEYNENTTARMRDRLGRVADETAMAKLRTFDTDSSGVTLDDTGPARLALIDGEHTNRAAFVDFVNLVPLMADDAVIAFHDANIVIDALVNVEAALGLLGRPSATFYLPRTVFVVALGDAVAPAHALLDPVKRDPDDYYRRSKLQLWKRVADSAAAPKF